MENFTLDNKGVSKITFSEEVDLSVSGLGEKFKTLDQLVRLESGYVSINTDSLPELNKPAMMTMSGLDFAKGSLPVILRNGVVADDTVVSDLKYKSGVLTFSVTGFSEYVVRPTIKLDQTDFTTDELKATVSGFVDDLQALGTIKINGETEDLTIDRKGFFQYEVTLKENTTNKIIVTFTSSNGAVDQKSLTINQQGKKVEATSPVGKIVQNKFFYPVIFTIAGVFLLGIVLIVLNRKKKKPSVAPVSPETKTEPESEAQETT